MPWQLVLVEWLYCLQKTFFYPPQKTIGKELLAQSVPEVLDVIAKQKSSRQAAKTAVKKTIKKQIGGNSKRYQKKRKTITKSKRKQRSRSDFFSKVKNVA